MRASESDTWHAKMHIYDMDENILKDTLVFNYMGRSGGNISWP